MFQIAPKILESIRDLARQNFVEIVEQNVVLSKSGRSHLKGLCPFHREATPSFHINPEEGLYHCFGCGAGGDAIAYIANQLGDGSFMSAVQYISYRYNIPIEGVEIKNEEELSQESRYYKILEKAWLFYQDSYKKAKPSIIPSKLRAVLRPEQDEADQIGFTGDDIYGLKDYLCESLGYLVPELLTLGLIVESRRGYIDFFRNRIIFPIHNHRGQLVGFAGRYRDKRQSPKYLNSPDSPIFHKQQILYNFRPALQHIRSTGRVYITEGYLDCLSLINAGHLNTVALMGTDVSGDRFKPLISRSHEYTEIIFCLDNDNAGRNATIKAVKEIAQFIKAGQVRISVLTFESKYKDINDYLSENPKESLKAEDYPSWLIKSQIKLIYTLKNELGASDISNILKSLGDYLAICPLDYRLASAEVAVDTLSELLSGGKDYWLAQVHRLIAQSQLNGYIAPQQDKETELVITSEDLLLSIYIHQPHHQSYIRRSIDELEIFFTHPTNRRIWLFLESSHWSKDEILCAFVGEKDRHHIFFPPEEIKLQLSDCTTITIDNIFASLLNQARDRRMKSVVAKIQQATTNEERNTYLNLLTSI